MEYLIKQYPLETGALEIQYIEEYFGEFPRKKSATEIVSRLRDREFLILMAEAPLRDDPGTIVPVAFKVVHEIRSNETEPKLADLVTRLKNSVMSRIAKCFTAGWEERAATGEVRGTSGR